MQMIRGFHWYEYPVSWFFYAVSGTLDHVIIFALGCLVLVSLSFWWRTSYKRLVSRWGVFNIILFLAGAAVSGFWDCLVYGRLYVTADYVSDFSPFIPVTQSVIDAHFDDYSGHLIGVSLRQLQLVWSLFAVVTWTFAAIVYLRGPVVWSHVTHLTMRWSEPPPAVRPHFR